MEFQGDSLWLVDGPLSEYSFWSALRGLSCRLQSKAHCARVGPPSGTLCGALCPRTAVRRLGTSFLAPSGLGSEKRGIGLIGGELWAEWRKGRPQDVGKACGFCCTLESIPSVPVIFRQIQSPPCQHPAFMILTSSWLVAAMPASRRLWLLPAWARKQHCSP